MPNGVGPMGTVWETWLGSGTPGLTVLVCPVGVGATLPPGVGELGCTTILGTVKGFFLQPPSTRARSSESSLESE